MSDLMVFPPSDPRLHLPLERLRAALAALPAPPRDLGTVALVVERHPDDARRTPAVGVFAPGEGLRGDRWSLSERRHPEAEVTLMRADVARLVCNGQDLSLPGDNLLVELDLSAENLPAGSKLQVGEVLLEITAKPHTGCLKFERRFGADARALTALDDLKPLRLRGIHARVVSGGAVRPGDAVRVLGRG
ncbi:MOSC domain-containing protein [Myxococcota bacterium]|nr:MOSC domain-containing protein [Myxococcota bacterium]